MKMILIQERLIRKKQVSPPTHKSHPLLLDCKMINAQFKFEGVIKNTSMFLYSCLSLKPNLPMMFKIKGKYTGFKSYPVYTESQTLKVLHPSIIGIHVHLNAAMNV